MRVLHIIPTLASGGAEKMLVDITEEMKSQGVWVEVLVLSKADDFYGDRIKELGIPIHFSPVGKVYHPLQIKVVSSYIKRNFDIVHAHLFAPQLYAAFVKPFISDKPIFITTEHNTHNRRREKKYFKVIDSWMYKKYEKIIANTEGTKSELIAYLPGTTSRTIVVQNGIYLNKYRDAVPIPRHALVEDYQENEKLVVMVAAMREQKDYETLIRAAKLLPATYHILLVGTGERLAEVKDYADRYGKGNVHFLGRREDIPSILKSCDIFVLSSHWEGFGLVAVEAMAAGLPVIVSDVPGLREVVGETGILFEVGNEEELKSKIVGVTLDSHLAEEDEKLLQFSIEKMVAGYLRIYEEQTGDRI